MEDDLLEVLTGRSWPRPPRAHARRERVARVQARVRELPDALEREVVEFEELPYAREVEEAVSLDGARQRPEEHAQDDARPGRPPAPEDGDAGRPRRITAAAREAAAATPSSARTSSSGPSKANVAARRRTTA